MSTIILGLGKTGLSCARYLVSQGKQLILSDTRKNPPNLVAIQQEFPDIKIYVGPLDENLLATADEIIISPGLSIHDSVFCKARNKNIPIISDIELFARHVTAPIVAITGSNGKSTVTTLVGEMAKAAGLSVIVAGNIGLPVCDLLNQPQPHLYVLELSSFQLATTFSLAPLAATILNITPDHLDWHGDFEDYRKSKHRIYHNAKYKICNRNDNLTLTVDPTFTFGDSNPRNDKEFGINENYLVHGKQKLLAISELQIIGIHNQCNALAALALGVAIDLPLAAMQKVLREFKGLSHRCELVVKFNGVHWYNDSKATNDAAAITAISSIGPLIQGKIILIAGGDAKGADLTTLRPVVKQYVSHVILLGKDADLLQQALEGYTEISRVKDLTQAVKVAANYAKAGDSVLLAPACSSLDMFIDYQDRGKQFKENILKLCQNQ